MKISLKKLIKAKNNLDCEIKAIEEKLKPFIDFNFFVMNQPSDGFVIVTEDFGFPKNAMLGSCIGVIEEKGILKEEDYLHLCI